MRAEDMHQQIERDISELPVFRFDWFFKSPSAQELQRNTLLGMIEKETEVLAQQEGKSQGRGKVCVLCLGGH